VARHREGILPVRIVRSAGRIQLVEQGDVVSDLLLSPGPTDDLFDVLAAAVVATSHRQRFAMLGFAAGGVLAPLRALGFAGPVLAVDSSELGHELFRRHASSWSGPVRFELADARRWLSKRRAPLDVVLDDLSVKARGGHVKPGASFQEIPSLIRARLSPGGISIATILPPVDRTWTAALRAVTAPWRRAVVVSGDEWENRITIAGDTLPEARDISRSLRTLLRGIGSQEAGRIFVRRFS
jgi:hypothetical protein